MGRPKEHDEETRDALRAAAERLVAAGGPDALSVRAVADEAGTTTRAVYSLFGSKEGLLAALAAQAFEQLLAKAKGFRPRKDPIADLIQAGMIFREFVLEHPSLYRIAFQRIVPGLRADPDLVAAREKGYAFLRGKVQRLADAGLLDGKPVIDAVREFNAMCEGLANAELRGATLPILPRGREDKAWRAALETVVAGFRGSASPAIRRRART